MRSIRVYFGLVGAFFLFAAMAAMPEPASAKGCLKGAFVGGVAGHYAGHHTILGAAAGCLVGRHEAKKKQENQTTGRGNGQHSP